jgi:hypothetical protein
MFYCSGFFYLVGFLVGPFRCTDCEGMLVETLVCFESSFLILIMELVREENGDCLAMLLRSLL